MADFLDQLATLFLNIVDTIGYPGVFLVMFLENVIPPIPTDPLLPFAGMLVAEGRFSFPVVWGLAVSGALIGSLLLYSFGMWADERVIRSVVRRYGRWLEIGEPELDRAMASFNRYGAWFIFFGRMIPLIRTAVTVSAGMSRMPLPKFVFFTVLNSLTITGFWIFVGVQLGENWTDVLDWVRRYQPVLGVLLLAAMSWLLFGQIRRRRRKRLGPIRATVDEADPAL